VGNKLSVVTYKAWLFNIRGPFPYFEETIITMLPLLSSSEEPIQPAEVISNFFMDFSVPEVRDMLSQLIEVAITTDNVEFSEPESRSELMCFYHRLGELIEAVYTSATTDQSSSPMGLK